MISHPLFFIDPMDTPPIPFLTLWGLWCLQAIACALQVRWFASRIGTRKTPVQHRYCPRATVIVPVKGAENDIPALIQSLSNQDYDDYQLLFVLEDENDPAYDVLSRELAGRPKIPSRVVTAGLSPPYRSQKVHNLLKALAFLEPEAHEHDVWCFADSDIVPAPEWLAYLVAPLENTKQIAVTTGYRWLIPEPVPGNAKTSFWSTLASVMNSVTATLQGRPDFNQAWGGSMAIRVSTARRANLCERWREVLTDDYPMTAMARDLGMRVEFVPNCLVKTPISFTCSEFFRFARRQYMITRVYSPWLWLLALTATWLYTVAFVTAWVYAGLSFHHAQDPWIWLCPLSAVLVVGTADQLRATYRRRCVQRLFGNRIADALRKPLQLDRWGTILCMAIHGMIVFCSAFGRVIEWRGIRYRMKGPRDIRRLEGD